MERHDTTMRAARYLIGAGTFAAAMLAVTAGSAGAQTSVCYDGGEGTPTFCGHVFTDANTDGNWDDGEGTANVNVVITDSAGNNVANSPVPSGDCVDPLNPGCGYYAFVVYEPPDTNYWICLVTDPAEADCRDTAVHPESVAVTVGTTSPFHDFEVGDDGENQEPAPGDIWGVGTGTPGYWKNHPEAWPAEGVTVGGIAYTIEAAITLMGKVSGDKTVSMFAALISAKLNATLANNTACITETIASADLWMAAHPVGSGVKASSAAWAEADAWHTLLDDYNNGKLCAPHRG